MGKGRGYEKVEGEIQVQASRNQVGITLPRRGGGTGRTEDRRKISRKTKGGGKKGFTDRVYTSGGGRDKSNFRKGQLGDKRQRGLKVAWTEKTDLILCKKLVG